MTPEQEHGILVLLGMVAIFFLVLGWHIGNWWAHRTGDRRKRERRKQTGGIMPLLIVLALLAWGQPVGAEILHDPRYQVWSEGKNVTQEFYGRQIVMEARGWAAWPDPCLAQMESAMRAMEPWILFYALGGVVTDPESVNVSQAIWQQWEAAKQCWRSK